MFSVMLFYPHIHICIILKCQIYFGEIILARVFGNGPLYQKCPRQSKS